VIHTRPIERIHRLHPCPGACRPSTRGSPRNQLSELADTSCAGYSRGQGDGRDWEIQGSKSGRSISWPRRRVDESAACPMDLGRAEVGGQSGAVERAGKTRPVGHATDCDPLHCEVKLQLNPSYLHPIHIQRYI
jgi:hypothetical protein